MSQAKEIERSKNKLPFESDLFGSREKKRKKETAIEKLALIFFTNEEIL